MDTEPKRPTSRSEARVLAYGRVLRLKEVCKVTGLGRSYIYLLQAEKRFPHSINIGTRAVGWLEAEVAEWIEQRVKISRVTP